MAYGSLTKHQPHVPSSAKLKGPILKYGYSYVLEPPMQEGKVVVWFSRVLNPYSISVTIHAFMGPRSRPNKKLQNFESFFPCFSSCKPLVFEDEYFDLSFIINRVFCASHSINKASYISWMDMVQKKKEKV